MNISFNFSRKIFYTLLLAITVVTLSILVYSYSADIPNPGHGGDSVLITVNGVDMNLQEALDNDIINTDQSGGLIPWPDGSYCIIQTQGTRCPKEFQTIDPTDGNQDLTTAIYGGRTSRFGPKIQRAKGSDGTYSAYEWAFCCK